MALRLLTLIYVAMLLAAYPPSSEADEPEFLPVAQRVEDFAAFCKFVADEYAYFDLKNVSWERACEFYATQVPGATTKQAYIGLLERALGELYDAHAHLGTNTPRSSRLVPSQTDLAAKWIDGKAIVSDVRRGAAAERAGVRRGFEIVSINGEAVVVVVEKLEPKFLSRKDPAAREWALQVALAGHWDHETTRLLAKTRGRTLEIEFAPTYPKPNTLLSHRFVGDVGYVAVHNSLGEPGLVPGFDQALAALRDAKALVIDLRDTPSGGTSSVARGVLGRLVPQALPYQRHELISEYRSSGVRRVWVELVSAREPVFVRPVVVLVGPWTGSMSEGLAIGLNATRGAPVLGRPMAHLLGALSETVLPHSGIAVRVPAEKLFHVDGTPREAFVPCDVPASRRTSLDADADADPELEAAVRLASSLGRSKSRPRVEWKCAGQASHAVRVER